MKRIASLCLSVGLVAANLCLSAPTIAAPSNNAQGAVTQTEGESTKSSFWERYQQAWSTILSAFVGFSGLILVTGLSLRQNRRSFKKQAELDRKAQESRWEQELLRQNREQKHAVAMEQRRRDEDAISLARALAAELHHVKGRISAFVETSEEIAKGWDDFAAKSDAHRILEDNLSVSWPAPCYVYSANTHRLGELPQDVALGVISAYSNAIREKAEELATPEVAAVKIRSNANLGKIVLGLVGEAIEALEIFIQGSDKPELPFYEH